MTDSLDTRSSGAQVASGLNLPHSGAAAPSAEMQVTLTLPASIVSALQQASPQPLDQQILALLHQALSCSDADEVSNQPVDRHQAAVPAQESTSQHPASDPLLQEIEQLKQRITGLEALLSRVEAIEGKVDRLVNDRTSPEQAGNHPVSAMQPASDSRISSDSQTQPPQEAAEAVPMQNKGDNPGSSLASIWMQIQQNDRPPASIPSTLQAEPCPKCQQRLMPFKSTGRVVCIQCGWTEKLDNSATDAALGDTDIHKLLEQATIESMENMKPRKRST